MAQQWAIGIDLGGTKLGLALVDSTGRLISHKQVATGLTPEAILADIVASCSDWLSSYMVTAVGVGIAGQVDESSGTVLFAPNLAWYHVPLQDTLSRQLDIPVVVLNDVRAATWGEWHYGAGLGCHNLLCLYIGTGVGGGLVANGQLLTGATNTAGEVGHTTLVWNGRLCSCGHRGCLEAYVSGWAIAQTLAEAVQRVPSQASTLLALAEGDLKHLRGEHLAAAYAAGDPLAIEIFEYLADALGAGCITLINAFNPEKLVLGGGVIAGMPALVPKVTATIKKGALLAATHNLAVTASTLANTAPLLGAAAAALHKVNV